MAKDALKEVIIDTFIEAESKYDYLLDNATLNSIVDGWTTLIEEAADKFIKGGKEHNPNGDNSWFGVNFEKEKRAELIDTIHYNFGADALRKNPSLAQHGLAIEEDNG